MRIMSKFQARIRINLISAVHFANMTSCQCRLFMLSDFSEILKFYKPKSLWLLLFSILPSLLLVTIYSTVIIQPVVSQSDDQSLNLIEDTTLDARIVAEGLNYPTSMAFVGHDDILVTERINGTVKRILNGTIQKDPLIKLDVNSHLERGLLGLTVTREQGNDTNQGIPKYIFLFYTEDKYVNENGSNDNPNCAQQVCEENEFSNRLYRYELRNDTLVNPKILIDIPIYWNNRVYPSILSEILHGASDWVSYPMGEGIHQGGALVNDDDNNIYLITGDGGGCRTYDGCKKSVEKGYLSTQSANKINGSMPVGMGGILRVTADGQPVDKRGVIGEEHPLNLYYGYGIRNSFGIDFDPITGNLWDTENGPEFGDEINLVEPGFNSGWSKIQGIWPLNYTLLIDNVSSIKGYHYPPISAYDGLEDFNGEGQYSAPELAWNMTRGLTAIKFLDTDMLGKKYENDLFVADSVGNIYNFDLNNTRTGLDLKGPLSDKIANSTLELRDSIFGHNFGTITDMEVGPDGYLYVLSYDWFIGHGSIDGKIFKIIPKDVK